MWYCWDLDLRPGGRTAADLRAAGYKPNSEALMQEASTTSEESGEHEEDTNPFRKQTVSQTPDSQQHTFRNTGVSKQMRFTNPRFAETRFAK